LRHFVLDFQIALAQGFIIGLRHFALDFQIALKMLKASLLAYVTLPPFSNSRQNV
jgi:hypothetical protein